MSNRFQQGRDKNRADDPDELGNGTIMGAQGVETITAFSYKHPFMHQTGFVYPKYFANWDGQAVFLFGRISYRDTFGNLYCTPFMAVNGQGGGLWAEILFIDVGSNRRRGAFMPQTFAPLESSSVSGSLKSRPL